jgi:site-specific recombinase XerD
LPAIAQADTDAQLVDLWVRRHESPNTRRNYRRQAERFMAWIGKPLVTVRLGDLQGYLQTLEGQASATRAATAALKSLFTFAQETGFLRFNVGRAVKSPSVKNTLAERIMPETDMLRLHKKEARVSGPQSA